VESLTRETDVLVKEECSA